MILAASKIQKSFLSAPGWSLMELLITICILAVVMNIALMAMGSTRQGAEDQKDKRNAQEIANVAAMANAAGASFVVVGDEKATIENLRTGTTPETGAFSGRLFQISSMQDDQIKGAMRFLALNDTELQYRMDGSSIQ
jgi:Tfp pilus assembly protein FimT